MLRPCKVIKVLFSQTDPNDWKTRKRAEEEVGRGLFHQWGTETLEDHSGHVCHYTVGIVEWRDGSIELVQPDHIVFLDAPGAT